MIEIVNVKDLKKGDIILVEGLEYQNQVNVVTIKKTTKEGLIIPVELGGLDYSPEDPDAIVRIGTIQEEPVLTILAQKMNIALSKSWQTKFKK